MNLPLDAPCPECKSTGMIEKRIYHAPIIGDAVRLGITKTDDGFKSVLKSIHTRTPGSQLDKMSKLTPI